MGDVLLFPFISLNLSSWLKQPLLHVSLELGHDAGGVQLLHQGDGGGAVGEGGGQPWGGDTAGGAIDVPV